VTPRISNSTPPVETTGVTGAGPKRTTTSGPLQSPSDGAKVSELSRAVAAALEPDNQKIEALRREVQGGTYVIDPVKVIEKILDTQNSK
jgi:anti-sigma28 factor (negative regulator of flagellin synthesis)